MIFQEPIYPNLPVFLRLNSKKRKNPSLGKENVKVRVCAEKLLFFSVIFIVVELPKSLLHTLITIL